MLFSVEGLKKLKIMMRIANSFSSMQQLPIEVQLVNINNDDCGKKNLGLQDSECQICCVIYVLWLASRCSLGASIIAVMFILSIYYWTYNL
jgi:hypothetical protein